MTTPSETNCRNTSKTYYKLDHSAIIGMHFSHRSWPDHFKAFPNVRLAQTRMWQPNIMVWGLKRATEAVGFVNGLAWPGLAGRLLQTLISITLQNLSWTSSFCHHRIALSSPILIGSFQHYTSNSLSSQTLTNFMNLILSWLPALGHYKCDSLSTQALTGTTNRVLSSLPISQTLRM